MRKVYADTSYWIAILSPRDEHHEKANETTKRIGDAIIYTSEMVLVELLNSFSSRGGGLKNLAVSFVRKLQSHTNVKILPQTREQFNEALELYSKRSDKSWSLTDCASFILMNQKQIEEALTNDHHFEQAGFKIMLK